MQLFADIVLPVAVRQVFTYTVPSTLRDQIEPGRRVWIPFQRHMAIGMVVRIHENKPGFKTRNIEKILDKESIFSDELLGLTEWIHRFYYCGWGEVIQAALPVGLNFYSEKYVKVSAAPAEANPDETEQSILDSVAEKELYSLKEAEKRWADGKYRKKFRGLIKSGHLVVWEEPEMKMEPRTEKAWRWAGHISEKDIHRLLDEYHRQKKAYKWIQALEILAGRELPEVQSRLMEHELLDHYTLGRIAKEGLIVSEQMETSGTGLNLEYDPARLKRLNTDQKAAYERIREPMQENRYESFLLYGVTGSGKTEVYIHALRQAVNSGRGGLVLVPEISLTPQTVKRFYQIFGDNIAVLHSRLSSRERYDSWKALQKGEKKIAIGARSAVFAPVQNLGLIVVDEEHDSSYKQEDPAPRYHARDVAIMRGYLTNSVVMLGSATPSMVALQMARKGKSTMQVLSKRHKGATLPEVHVLDLKHYRAAMRGPLAVPLYDAIEKAMNANEQIILLHNRRGFSSYLQCEECGHIPECPNCSVSLTYHKAKQKLRCHYCGYVGSIPYQCGWCSSHELKKKGLGTQQVEEEIARLFPDARITRMDRDTTSGRHSHEQILGRFDRREIDILLGTQLVAKGLDFPNVTVVGVINADTELAFPSFRSSERMYQLLSQVAGRSGRAEKKGSVYIQTWQSDHYAVQCAREHDHRKFSRFEMAHRKELFYPPYSRLIGVLFKSRDAQTVARVAHTFTHCMKEIAGDRPVLGPSPAAITKMQGWIRWECLLKMAPSDTAGSIEQMMDRIFALYEKRKPVGASGVRINVNVDAIE